ncbi:MAG: WYL domain-containing protein [Elusimicrobiales bacterium]|nr:WYL domain-containing protein [Elusimicrobiales bacterium]
MPYSELIKNFDKIRGYMRHFFAFGFKGREDFKGKSTRSYDNERRRLESWLKGYMSFYQDSSGKKAFISADSREVPHNPLYQAFKAKSFTAGDITFHFVILDMLSGGETLSFRQISKKFYEEYFPSEDIHSLPDESAIRKKLKEYAQLGILRQTKSGRETSYSLVESSIDFAALIDAIDFYSESDPLGVIGSYLLDKIQAEKSNFRYKHHYMLHALDMQIMLELLTAIRQKRCAQLKFADSRGRIKEHTVFPIKIYISAQSGRQYLFSWHYKFKKPHIYRIDYIRSVHPGNEERKAEKYLEYHREFAKNMWGISFVKGYKKEHIEMTVRLDPGEEYIVGRLEREKRCGEIMKISENEYRYSADTYDCMEMMPWIRTFIGRITHIECGSPEVVKTFKDDLERTLANYGGE